MTDRVLRKCPECDKKKLVRLIGAGAGLIFKGSGFYLTDYRDKSYAEAAKKDADPSSTSEPAKASGAAKSDSSANDSGTASSKAADPKTGGKSADKSADKSAGTSAGKSGKKPS
jgi:predicted nucleic acid-binding Zn ribbon protein